MTRPARFYSSYCSPWRIIMDGRQAALFLFLASLLVLLSRPAASVTSGTVLTHYGMLIYIYLVPTGQSVYGGGCGSSTSSISCVLLISDRKRPPVDWRLPSHVRRKKYNKNLVSLVFEGAISAFATLQGRMHTPFHVFVIDKEP